MVPHCVQICISLMISLGQEDLEKKATHSCVLAWKIPWTVKPGRLQSIELQSQND